MLRNLLLYSLLVPAASLAAQHHECTIDAAGSGCARLQITMTPQGGGGVQRLLLQASALHPRSHGGMAWGMVPMDLPILPGSACPLLTDFVWGHTFMTDTTGSYSWGRAWPGWFHGFFYMQMGSIGFDDHNGFDVKTTDCWLVRCSLP